MPTRRAALAEVHHTAVVVRGVPGFDDGLARPGNRPSPPFNPISAFHWDIRYVSQRYDLHDVPLLMFTDPRYPNSVPQHARPLASGMWPPRRRMEQFHLLRHHQRTKFTRETDDEVGVGKHRLPVRT